MRLATVGLVGVLLGVLVHAAACEDVLYIRIVLPETWPPQAETLTCEPMQVPYLKNRPEVTSIDVGRKLFVDDSLLL